MTMLGALPQFLSPEAQQAATIGFGTGLTSHVLLASPKIQTLDTIEIEPAVLVAARAFPAAQRTRLGRSAQPGALRRRQDLLLRATEALRRHRLGAFNPWVSGVSGLFSIEFYRDARRYLRD